MPVTFAKEGETVRISSIQSGWSLKKRLTELGFVVNEPVKIIKNSDFGPIILEIKDTRLAIGRSEAHKIIVK